ncbi:hypothetical protein A2715_00335 [Candidatus Woesebacteria bacterium RIFCSPHIGHO2_01_FULL_39_32]|uniref:Alpha-glucan phosphorylase n=2 Tax=Candidatus Woeseibacteriota TaxID=1752722 RepID=A0A1F8BMP3_9BACT|nr:MAG: hypothetical protein A2715_00335 [Candidatus Woesebacteria bacterium RIFCSPHIGHO2_01_FULL_39_32]OGM35400.1 MAG: hypothetical protein A3F01_04690 [Candidatus Woesebacteria bacterium RIFCSPHIGHO2_12_FULL_38_11]OGM65344.1 MAG: hypothetical protein A2893_01290 [Candidatus Woesebacteria bacterium RIFCSPLOWO2_01_FULL_39_25]
MLKVMKLREVSSPVAYFCAEFAIDNELPTYSGGLGILAGDVMHEAAQEHYPMVGIGILYKGKEFMQHITGAGREEQRDSEFDHDTSFLRPTTIEGKPLILNLSLEASVVKIKSYHIRLSDTTLLFFLSTDVDGNPSEWISDMDALYKGDVNSQIRQQILLGVGGIKLLKALSITPSFYHINEGRPAFCIWEIVKNEMEDKQKSFEDSWEKAIKKIVYTNHTLVAAGNPTYSIELIERWATPFARKMKVDTNLLIKDGLVDPGTFSISQFALNISSKHSSVSKVHADYAKRQYPDYKWIAITNGVYMPRWQDSDFRDPSLTDKQIWDMHLAKKYELMETVVKRTGFGYDPERLVITWARRLAEYKQPKAIFKDIERLKKILSKADRPIQLLFAGNTHSGDPNAKSIVEDIISIFSGELSGHAIFVPNYNISLANHFVSGSDVWLNTPKGNLEACGTSGMKAISNGVLNCTVHDGWTYEVDWEGIGWTLDPENVADSLYKLIEDDIAPSYYRRNEEGLPIEWIGRMRKSIEVSKKFSTKRMLEGYKKLLYC